MLELGRVINKVRVIQGWNILGPEETKPLAVVWAEQLDRFGVPPAVYDELLNRCIDFRRTQLLNGHNVTALSIELFLAMFQSYRSELQMSIELAEKEVERLDREINIWQETWNVEAHICPYAPEADHSICEERFYSRKQSMLVNENVYRTAARKPAWKSVDEIVGDCRDRLATARQKLNELKPPSHLYEHGSN